MKPFPVLPPRDAAADGLTKVAQCLVDGRDATQRRYDFHAGRLADHIKQHDAIMGIAVHSTQLLDAQASRELYIGAINVLRAAIRSHAAGKSGPIRSSLAGYAAGLLDRVVGRVAIPRLPDRVVGRVAIPRLPNCPFDLAIELVREASQVGTARHIVSIVGTVADGSEPVDHDAILAILGE